MFSSGLVADGVWACKVSGLATPFDERFQRRNVLSEPAVTTERLSGLNVMALRPLSWPRIVSMGQPKPDPAVKSTTSALLLSCAINQRESELTEIKVADLGRFKMTSGTSCPALS